MAGPSRQWRSGLPYPVRGRVASRILRPPGRRMPVRRLTFQVRKYTFQLESVLSNVQTAEATELAPLSADLYAGNPGQSASSPRAVEAWRRAQRIVVGATRRLGCSR